MTAYHIAQINIARMLAPIDSDTMSGFVARIDEINALADTADGFIWRLQGEEGNATALRVFADDMLIINMSVWESIDALHAYTYKSDHAQVFRRRKDWFSLMEKPHMALWYIPAGHIPTPDEAKHKLALIEKQGASPSAFTFVKRFELQDWLAIQGN